MLSGLYNREAEPVAMIDIVPALSAVVATADRGHALKQTLESLASQNTLPSELLVVDASSSGTSREIVRAFSDKIGEVCSTRWFAAEQRGAAAQRNQGVSMASGRFIWFLDDDVILQTHCLKRLWSALQSQPDVGGASAMITNQKYHEPGAASRLVYRLLGGGPGPDYAGRIFGPAVNLLPADREGMPEIVPVGWLNTTCTLYRREALPDPPFASFFTGYSMMEDAALSLVVARKWKLVNARTARIFHDTQPGKHKDDAAQVARMAVVNRDFVARRILGKKGIVYWSSLVVWAAFQLAAQVGQLARNPKAWGALKGSIQGYADIVFGRSIAQY
jgi:glycosyltransferase involved in cell wall biosynthesis